MIRKVLQDLPVYWRTVRRRVGCGLAPAAVVLALAWPEMAAHAQANGHLQEQVQPQMQIDPRPQDQDQAQSQEQVQVQVQSQVQEQAKPREARARKPLEELAEGVRCGSVVIRHCRLRRETSSVVLDPKLRGRNGAPMQWEVVQFGGPDNDEIVVNGERIRDPGVAEVFVRTFGSPLDSSGMRTRYAAGGARCTVAERSGATVCSNSGDGPPAAGFSTGDWTDWTF